MSGRGQSTDSQLTNIRVHIRKIIFIDVFSFVVIFLAALFNSLASRSIIFDIVIGVTMLFKVFIGACFYSKRTLGSVRCYFISRYCYNVIIVCPVFVIMRKLTNTYLPNYFLAGGILLFIETTVGLYYVRYLYKKHSVEIIEDIPGFKIVSNT